MNPEKLALLKENVRMGGKGTPRRKTKKTPAGSKIIDDKKLHGALKKLSVQSIPNIEEVNMFRDDGQILHFAQPKIQASVASQTFAVYGKGELKDMLDLPEAMTQVGDQQQMLQQLLQQLQNNKGSDLMNSVQSSMGGGKMTSNEDDDLPELVSNFEDTADDIE